MARLAIYVAEAAYLTQCVNICSRACLYVAGLHIIMQQGLHSSRGEKISNIFGAEPAYVQHGLHVCCSSCTCIYAGAAAYVQQQLHTCGGAYVYTAGAQYICSRACNIYSRDVGPAGMQQDPHTCIMACRRICTGLHVCSRGCICAVGAAHM